MTPKIRQTKNKDDPNNAEGPINEKDSKDGKELKIEKSEDLIKSD